MCWENFAGEQGFKNGEKNVCLNKAIQRGGEAVEQDFQLVSVDAANAKHVGAVFQSVYGNDFPIQYVYQPEAVAAEIAAERLTAVLAFDAEGQPAGYVSMFKNAPNFQLWEVGNMVVNPVYRQSRLSLLLANCCQSAELMNIAGSDGLYSEAVCHHYMTQVGSAKAGMADYALEIDQLAGSSFKEHCADTERISCVFNFIEYTKPSLPTYIPHVYEDMARTLLQPLKKRDILVSTAALPQQGNLRQEEKYYEFAGTWKLAVWETGATWSEDVAALLAEAERRNVVSLQVAVNMALPHLGAAVEELRKQGFFFGGVLPRWFGSDGLLMQVVLGGEPNFAGAKLYTQTARTLRQYCQADWELRKT